MAYGTHFVTEEYCSMSLIGSLWWTYECSKRQICIIKCRKGSYSFRHTVSTVLSSGRVPWLQGKDRRLAWSLALSEESLGLGLSIKTRRRDFPEVLKFTLLNSCKPTAPLPILSRRKLNRE